MKLKYSKIAHELREAIVRGDYPPGSKLPALPELMNTYGVARGTVREAIATLANEGLVTAQSGVGTVVRDLGVVKLGSSRQGQHPVWAATAGSGEKAIVLEAGWIPADREIADRLQIDVETPTVRRIRHYYKGRDVVLTQEQWIPANIVQAISASSGYDAADRRADEQADKPADLYSLLRSAGQAPAETTETISARMPDPNEKEAMNMAAGIPVLLTTRIVKDSNGTPLETSDFVGCADRMSQTYTVAIPAQ